MATLADRLASLRLRPLQQQMQEYQQYAGDHFVPDAEHQLVADPGRRTGVRFPSPVAGLHLAGHLYRPPGVSDGEVTPGVVLCGPISAVKEQVVPHYAERLADAGYTCLTFDPRRFGESDGEARFFYDPSDVIADYHAAARYLFGRDDVDAGRVAALGVCMGGGYAVSLGAREKRLQAVVAVAGGYNIGGTFQQMQGVEGFAEFFRQVNQMVQEQVETGEVRYMPTIAQDPDTLAAMPNAEAYSFYDRTSKDHAPNWSDRFAVASLEPYFAYNATGHAPLVAPTPLMLIHGSTDLFLLPEYAEATYEAYPTRAGTKELVWIETHNHIELYDQAPYVPEAVAHAVRWLDQHVKTKEAAPSEGQR